jgi:glycosyltransferase involved in cell wall biosynthesis
MPEVSIVLATYQHAAYVAEAVESALAQTYTDREVIVVDDGSTDETAEVLSGFGDRIIVQAHPRNRGLAAARNTGIRASRGKYVAFLDADDVWLPHKLDSQIPIFEQNEAVGLVGSDMLIFDKNGVRPSGAFEQVRPPSGFVFPILFSSVGRSTVLTPTVVVRRACFDDVGFFDETLMGAEDHDMWLRISRKWAFEFVCEPLVRYRMSANQLHKQLERHLTNAIRVQEKALAESPELHDLGLPALDRCLYDMYLQLCSVYLLNGKRWEARSVLRHYRQTRGRTARYWRMALAAMLPWSALRELVRLRSLIRGGRAGECERRG